MDHAQRAVAVLYRVGNDAQGEKIVNLIERNLLALELLVDRVSALDAGFHARRDAFTPQFGFHGAAHALEVLFVGGALAVDGARDFGVGFRIEIAEREIFQFAADLAHAEAVRDGRVDLQSLARDALPALRAQAAQRPHVVQTVGQLHDDDADVVDHREQHLAVTLRLAVFGRKEVDLAQLGDAVDAARHFVAEILLNVRRGDAGVFDDVVQQSGLDADDIHPHSGQDLRHGKRMAHVGLARSAHLPCVILRCEAGTPSRSEQDRPSDALL